MVDQALLVVLGSALLFLSPPPASAGESPKRVLIFSSEQQQGPGVLIVNQSIRSTLKNGLPGPCLFYYEAQDSFRIPNEKYEGELVRLLQRKYDGERFDLIYALGTPALKFLLKHRGELFTDTPLIYVVVDQRQVANLDLGPNVTGVGGKMELAPTLDIALALQPQTQRVVVVAGNASADTTYLALARQEFRPYEGKVEFTYLINLPIDELKKRLAGLPEKSVVFYLSVNSDPTTRIYTSPEVLTLLASSSSVPIYAASQIYIGNGTIGGRLLNLEEIGTRAAEIGSRILAGESPQNIPSQTIPSAAMFDWRQLRRWGIDEAKLPPGSIVRFREFSVWELYKWRIIGAVSLIILQAFLIIGLLISRAKRRKAEEASKLSETRYRTVVETQTELICRYQPDTTLTFVNDAYCRYFGKTSEQLIGTKFSELLPEYARDAALAHIASLIENPRREPYEREVVLRNGEVGWHEWVDHVAQPTNGDGIELQGIGRDITERRRAEEELRLSERRFRDMADSSTILIWLADADMQCTYFNQRILDFTGRTMDQLLGEGWLEIIHHDDVQRCVDAYTAGYEKREPFVLEFRIRRADGEFRWIYDTGAPRFGTNGELLGYIGSAFDMTDRKAGEEAKNNLAAIVETSDDAILSETLDGIIISWNAGAEKIYGYSANEIVGQHVSILAPPELKVEVQGIVDRVSRGEGVDHLETQRVSKEGMRIDVSLTISPIRNERGLIMGASTIARDITARKKAEVEERQHRTELAHLSRVTMLGELSGSLAHELNQPLTAILSNAQAAQRFLAHDDVDLNEVRDILGDIVKQDKRAGEVIHRLRLLLKKSTVEHQPLDLNEVVSEVLKLVRNDLLNQRVTGQMELAPELPTIIGDRVQLEQVVLNLVMNGCDAIATGPAANRKLIIRTALNNGDGVCVSVADQGVGLAPDNLEKVFEPFFSTKPHGMGLGLSVCRTIIAAHGGKLWAANNGDRGATFYFTIPAQPEIRS